MTDGDVHFHHIVSLTGRAYVSGSMLAGHESDSFDDGEVAVKDDQWFYS